ncbi:MAG: hypothetical protein HY716_17855 [Planctomycetes bacterium]|nr:hypothetical protein [Planctomycetota bacterium]
MRTFLLAFFLAAAPQDSGPATDEQADAAYEKFRKDIASNLESAQIQAVKDFATTRHEKTIRVLSRYLLWPNEEGAAQVAFCLGTLDHPLSVEVLTRALRPPLL